MCLLLAMTGVALLLLNSTTITLSTTFQIPTWRYLSILHEPNVIIICFKNTHVIIIDEMSMMTNNMLCVVEQPLKQPMHFENIFWFKKKVVLIVGNLAQLWPFGNILFKTMTYYAKVATFNCPMLENNKTTFTIHFHVLCYRSWVLTISQHHMRKKTNN